MNKLFIGLLLAVAFGLSALSGILTGEIVKGGIESSNKDQLARLRAASAQQQMRLHVAQVNGCYRTNQRQVAANANAFATWKFDVLFAADIAGPQQQPQTPRQQAQLAEFLAKLNETLHSLTWTPVVRDCQHHPTEVVLPVTFDARKPGKADLPPPPPKPKHKP